MSTSDPVVPTPETPEPKAAPAVKPAKVKAAAKPAKVEAAAPKLALSTADPAVVTAIAGRYHGAPFDILGLHPIEGGKQPRLVVRTVQPQADAVAVKQGEKTFPMRRVHAEGVFDAVFPVETEFFRYQLEITLPDGRVYTAEDPYRYPPVLTEFDLHLFGHAHHPAVGHHLPQVGRGRPARGREESGGGSPDRRWSVSTGGGCARLPTLLEPASPVG